MELATLADALNELSVPSAPVEPTKALMPCSTVPDGWCRSPPAGYESLDELQVNPDVMTLLRAAHAAGEWPVYLTGDVGRGKSYVAALVYARWTGTVAMARYTDLMGTAIRGAKEGDVSHYTASGQLVEMTEGQWWKCLESLGLLIVDEIGVGISVGNAKEWRAELFWKLLEIRHGKPLLMTGNISPDGLGEHFDRRIQSRIIQGTVIECDGTDKRREGVRGRLHRVKL
jgi:predicted ATPase